ncbi:MAG: Hint domain-containing protein [Rubellimicrobium sp.]|nr:Hint domain-containing protein [Rubellimicrobium sp.]
METGLRAVHAFSWAQTEVEDIPEAPPEMVVPGALWRWRGEALRLDGPQALLPLGPAQGTDETRARAARALRRWLDLPAAPPDAAEPEPVRQGFTVTDGRQVWEVALVATGPGRAPLAVIAGGLPPRDRDLWVVESDIVARPETMPETLLCFTPGTLVLCAGGWQKVERITEGMRVQTRDNGLQPVARCAAQRISGARLRLMPELAPVLVRMGGEALAVSPDHRLLLRGPRAQALFGCDEVLAAARDLVDDRRARLLRGLPEVHYLHLALPGHEVILANGIETESCPPDADVAVAPARRLLSRAETALVAQAA